MWGEGRLDSDVGSKKAGGPPYLILVAPFKLRVPHPCAFARVGGDAADTSLAFSREIRTHAFVDPALRKVGKGRCCALMAARSRPFSTAGLGDSSKSKSPPCHKNATRVGQSARRRCARTLPFYFHRPEFGFRCGGGRRAIRLLFPGRGLCVAGLRRCRGGRRGRRPVR